MNVQSVIIGECVKVIGGFAFKSKDFGETGKPVIRISNLQNGTVNTEGAVRILPEKVGKGSKATIIGGDILMALSGATTGKIGVVPENIEGPVYLNQRVGKFEIVNNMMIERAYLRHYLESGMIQSQVWKSAAGVAQPNISPKQLEAYQIPLPSISEQKRIAAILDKADALREKRRQAIAKLDELLQSVFLDMFGDPVTNPKGWNVVNLADAGSLGRGISKHRPRNAPELLDGPYPLIQTGEVANSGGYIRAYTRTYSEVGLKQSKIWPKGTLCITIAANIANTGILTFDACFPDSVVGFVPNERSTNEYIQHLFVFLRKILEEKAPQVAQKNINLSILRSLPIPLPDILLQQEFSKIIGAFEKTREKHRQHVATLDTLFASLQQRAFKGEL